MTTFRFDFFFSPSRLGSTDFERFFRVERLPVVEMDESSPVMEAWEELPLSVVDTAEVLEYMRDALDIGSADWER